MNQPVFCNCDLLEYDALDHFFQEVHVGSSFVSEAVSFFVFLVLVGFLVGFLVAILVGTLVGILAGCCFPDLAIRAQQSPLRTSFVHAYLWIQWLRAQTHLHLSSTPAELGRWRRGEV